MTRSLTYSALQPAVNATVYALRAAFLAMLAAYRALISPLLGPACRFFPSCSRYAAQAVQRHGVWKGLGLAACRLGKCHPWHPGGVDPVP